LLNQPQHHHLCSSHSKSIQTKILGFLQKHFKNQLTLMSLYQQGMESHSFQLINFLKTMRVLPYILHSLMIILATPHCKITLHSFIHNRIPLLFQDNSLNCQILQALSYLKTSLTQPFRSQKTLLKRFHFFCASMNIPKT